MAAVPVTINGVICDMYGRTITGPVKIVGEAMLTGLGVGGGPMPPGEGGGPVDPGYGKPPTFWPGHPLPPEGPGKPPDGEKPPDPIEPPVKWKAVWHPTEGWIVVGLINPDVDHPVPST